MPQFVNKNDLEIVPSPNSSTYADFWKAGASCMFINGEESIHSKCALWERE